MTMVGINQMRRTLQSLARKAWDFDEINVWIGAGGITVAPNSRPNQAVRFPQFVDGVKRDAYQDAVDFFRAEALVKFTSLDLDWEITPTPHDDDYINPVGNL